ARLFKNVKVVYQVLTHDSKDHIYDLKNFFEYVKSKTGNTPKLIDSISYKKETIKKLGLIEGRDFEYVEPLKNNFNWINFLAVPHGDKSLSCPIELYLNDKKIFYAGDCANIPFYIENYNEYYFDFSADQENEFFFDIEGIKRIVKKNKIKRNNLWLVHFISRKALQIAMNAELQVAKEEVAKFTEKVKTSSNSVKKQSIKEKSIAKTK
ncbi:MAG: hypothetical protein PHH71_02325, partial [Clostridia bacterium]|nr:hypothetical protein [Clostridia bacterium]